MTKRGVCTVITFALLLLVAMMTGYSEIYYFALVCGLVLLYSAASVLIGVIGINVSHSMNNYAVPWKGTTTFKMTWESAPILPVLLRVTVRMPLGGERQTGDYLAFRGNGGMMLPFSCPHRGRWMVGVVSTRCEDVFRLFSFKLRVKNRPAEPLYLTVYPLLVDLFGNILPPVDSDKDDSPMSINDSGDTFSDTRLYHSGDPLKRIHWKQSARTRELYTRQYESPASKMVMIVLDNISIFGELPVSSYGYADLITSAAASLLNSYLNAGHCVRLTMPGTGETEDVYFPGELTAAYTKLASVQFPAAGMPRAADIMTNIIPNGHLDEDVSIIYVFTHYPEPPLVESLSALCTRDRKVALSYPYPNNLVMPSSTVDGLRLIPIARPRDISDRLGGEML